MFDDENEYSSDHGGDYIRPTEEYRADCEDYHEHGQTYEDYNQEQQVYDAHNENEDEFRAMLMPGENLLWCGKSQKGAGMAGGGASCLTMIFPMFWTGFAVFWTLTAFLAGGLMAVFGIPFIVIGIFLFRQMGIGKTGKRSYAITDRRVIINSGGTIASDRLENIGDITYKETKNGLGYVSFVMLGAASTQYTTYGNGRLPVGGHCVFSGVRNPAEVYRILSNAVYSATRLK